MELLSAIAAIVVNLPKLFELYAKWEHDEAVRKQKADDKEKIKNAFQKRDAKAIRDILNRTS